MSNAFDTSEFILSSLTYPLSVAFEYLVTSDIHSAISKEKSYLNSTSIYLHSMQGQLLPTYRLFFAFV